VTLFDTVAAEATISELDAGNRVVDFTRWEKISLPAASILLAYFLSCRHDIRDQVRCIFLRNSRLEQFLYRRQFFTTIAASARAPVWQLEVHVDREVPFRPPLGQRFTIFGRYPAMPFTPVAHARIHQSEEDFQAECGVLVGEIAKVFRAAAGLGGHEILANARFILSNKELIHNIYTHSGVAGYGALQVTTDSIFACYGDIGCGIHASLEPYRLRMGISDADWTNPVAILTAFEYGVTSTLQGRGTGLPDTLQFVRDAGGFLQCRSGTTSLTFLPGRRQPLTRSVQALPGVQIALSLPVNRGERIENISFN